MLMVSTKPLGRRLSSTRADETWGESRSVGCPGGRLLNAQEEEAAAARAEVRFARAKAMKGCNQDAAAPSPADLTL